MTSVKPTHSNDSCREDARLLDPAYDDVEPSSSKTPHRCKCTCGATRDSFDEPGLSGPGMISRVLGFAGRGGETTEYGRIRLSEEDSRSPRNNHCSSSIRERFNKAALLSSLPHLWAFLRFAQFSFQFTVFVLMSIHNARKHGCKRNAAQIPFIIIGLLLSFYELGTLLYRRVNPGKTAKLIPLYLLVDIFAIAMHYLMIFFFFNRCERQNWYWYSGVRPVSKWFPLTITNLVLFHFTVLIFLFCMLRKNTSIVDQFLTAFYEAGSTNSDLNNRFRESKVYKRMALRRLKQRKLDELAQGLIDGTIQVVHVPQPLNNDARVPITPHAPHTPDQAPLFAPTPVSEASSSRAVVMSMVEGLPRILTPSGISVQGHSAHAAVDHQNIHADSMPPAYEADEQVIPVAGAPQPPQRRDLDVKRSATEHLLSVEDGSTPNPYNMNSDNNHN